MSYTYDIYLHDLSGGNGGASQTKPSGFKSPTKAEITATNEETGSNVAIITTAVAIATTLDKAITFLEPYVTSASGDYRFQVGYGNFKQTLNNITNPISSISHYLQTQHEYAIRNRKQEEERKLFGDTLINYNGGNV